MYIILCELNNRRTNLYDKCVQIKCFFFQIRKQVKINQKLQNKKIVKLCLQQH